MRSKSVEDALLHIRDNILLAQRFIGEAAYENFRNNQLVFYAVTRCLEIISEASRRLPDELKTRHPHIPWREMAAAGNVYRHEYEDVEQRQLWRTTKERLPTLLAAVEQELGTAAHAPRET